MIYPLTQKIISIELVEQLELGGRGGLLVWSHSMMFSWFRGSNILLRRNCKSIILMCRRLWLSRTVLMRRSGQPLRSLSLSLRKRKLMMIKWMRSMPSMAGKYRRRKSGTRRKELKLTSDFVSILSYISSQYILLSFLFFSDLLFVNFNLWNDLVICYT